MLKKQDLLTLEEYAEKRTLLMSINLVYLAYLLSIFHYKSYAIFTKVMGWMAK